LEPLPTCTDQNGTGGGIVSILDEFDDFGNSGLSPHQRMWIYLGVFGVLFICVIGACKFVCAKRESEKTTCNQDSQQDREDMNEAVKEEEDEDSVDELPLCWQ
jgi:flagellar basal body-associated protein FliL